MLKVPTAKDFPVKIATQSSERKTYVKCWICHQVHRKIRKIGFADNEVMVCINPNCWRFINVNLLSTWTKI